MNNTCPIQLTRAIESRFSLRPQQSRADTHKSQVVAALRLDLRLLEEAANATLALSLPLSHPDTLLATRT
jgi:hypothetical protein